MKGRLIDPKCMSLEWGNVIFYNHFTRLKYILCSPLLSLVTYFENNLGYDHTRYWGKSKIYIKNLGDWKCPNNIAGHERKFSIIKGAQTKLEGMKKYPNDPKKIKQKKNQYNNAHNQMKKTKRKSQSPTLGSMIDHFRRTF